MHALSKMYQQNASRLVKHSDLGAKNLNKICLKIVQKVLFAIFSRRQCMLPWKISKIFQGSMFPDPPTAIFTVNIL